MGCGIFRKNIIENTGIIQILGDRNRKGLIQVGILLASKVKTVIENKHHTHNDGKQYRKAEIPHTGNQSCTHSQEQRTDLLRRTRHTAEADKAKSTCYCHTGSHVTVDEHNNYTYHRRQKCQRYHKTLGIPGAVHIGECHHKTKHQGKAQAQKKVGNADHRNKIRIK